MARLANIRDCTGCGACSSTCRAGAISLRFDKEGFLYPRVDKLKCNECGMCSKSCPVLAHHSRSDLPRCYAARSNDISLVSASSSGGVFSELAIRIIGCGGVVFGAIYDGDDLTVRHAFVESTSELRKLRGSKYVQSEIGDAYKEVKTFLSARRPVLFSGTPCQVAGLLAYLHKPSDLLLTVEVICHGVPPPKLFDRLKSDLGNKHGKLTAISFRDKDQGWASRAITGWYEGAGKIREKGAMNAYFKAFIAHLSLRKCCERCRFNDGKSNADITLGDFWGIDRLDTKFADDRGVSAVILHTKNGYDAFSLTNCNSKEVSLSDITAANPSYRAKRRPNRFRNRFFKVVYDIGLIAATNKFICREPSSIYWRIFRKLRTLSLLIVRRIVG